MLKGGNTEAGAEMMANVNARLEQGIEQLRQKYEAQEAMAERQAELNARAAEVSSALCAQACAEKERLNPTVDMTMEDPDVESLRQERLNALKARAAAAKRHVQEGGGDYREIVEEDFLKEVRARQPARRRVGYAPRRVRCSADCALARTRPNQHTLTSPTPRR